MVGKKALANRAFLIDAWHNSVNANRPPKNRQELYDTAKASYAHINDGANFTCSGDDLTIVLHNLKDEYYKKPLDALRADSSNAENDSAFLYAELKRVCNTMQERMIRNARILIEQDIEARFASIINENNEAKAKLDKALALLRANNIDFDPNEFVLGKSTANKLDAILNNDCYCEDSDSNCMADKSKQALNAVLQNVVPGLDQSVDKILKDLSNTTAEIAPKSVGKADKLPSEQASLVAMPPKEQEMAKQAIKALDSLDNKSDSDLPQQTSMFIYIQTTPLQGQS